MSQQHRTPLARARGLGAAKSGTTDWIAQRVSAIALAPLSAWFVISAALALDGDYESARVWVSQSWNGVLLTLLILAAFYHMGAGMRVIIEDYIHTPVMKGALLLLNVFTWFGLAAGAVFSVATLSFGS